MWSLPGQTINYFPSLYIPPQIVVQNQVFGAGYPSLPTISLEEFYQQRYKEHVEQQQQQQQQRYMHHHIHAWANFNNHSHR